MRIISGHLKGRTLIGPTGPGLRPTSDRLRETLFNVLRDQIAGARVLDGFAGTGAVGLEAISRGAARATFVEHDRRAAAVLERNVARCGVADACVVLRESFTGLSGRHPRLGSFDLVFIDPPYDLANLEEAVAEAAGLTGHGGVVVLEHSRRRPAPAAAMGGQLDRVLVAGDGALAFYVVTPAADTMEQH